MRRLVLVAATPVAAVTVLLGTASPASANHGREFQFIKLSGAQEVPPADADGKGTFVSKADLKRKRLCYALAVRRIATPTAAHIHNAVRGMNGGITIGLTTPTTGFSSGCVTAVPDAQQTPANAAMTLTVSELRALVRDSASYYVNVHNGDFPAGAIRGQLR